MLGEGEDTLSQDVVGEEVSGGEDAMSLIGLVPEGGCKNSEP